MGIDGPFTVGDMEIYWLQGGNFRLDGGTMFGPVPKVLWERSSPGDAENTILMCNDPLLVKTPNNIILIDTGLGNKLTAKQKNIYKISTPWDLPAGFEELGIAREEVTHVVLTHGDFDHAGGTTMLNGQGGLELTCPNAIHYLQKIEWEDICNPHPRAKSVYLAEDFSLFNGRNLAIIDGDAEICPGIILRYTGGHTRGHQLVEIHSAGMSVVHTGDLFPTHFHSNPLWVMAYDNFPLDVINRKIRYFSEYAGKNSWFTFYHDPVVRACRLDSAYKVKEIWASSLSNNVQVG
jgi:glyoxylase-like metal-dependent hydrolase (beta-lactamase superfamily II)